MVMAAPKPSNAPSNIVDLAAFRAQRHPTPSTPVVEKTARRSTPTRLRTEIDERAVLVTSLLETANGFARTTYSFVLPNGDIHHFYSLTDGVHHSYSRKYRGSFEQAISAELERPGARIAGRFAEDLIAAAEL